MRNMAHVSNVANAAGIDRLAIDSDGRIARVGTDYARHAGGISRQALAVPADQVLALRLATLDGARDARDIGQYRRAAERVGRALALAGHCPYSPSARLDKWGTDDPVAIARIAIQ